MKRLRLAVLGCGRIALNTHLPILSAMDGVQIVALAEPDDNARARGQQLIPEASVTTGWREVIGRSDIDAVVVCLPSGLHAEAGVAALRARKHLYLEKPLAIDLQGARDVLGAWSGSGCVGMVGFNYRFNPLVIDFKKQLAGGRIGAIIGVRSVFSTRGGDLPGWKMQRSTGGGVLLDLGSHHVDLIRFLLDREIHDVSARITSRKSEADTAWLDLATADGIAVHSQFSLCAIDENRIEIYGENGKLALDLYRSTQVEYVPPSGSIDAVGALVQLPGAAWRRARKMVSAKLGGGSHQASYRAALTEFVSASLHGRIPSCNLNDGFASLAVIDAAERSAQTGGAAVIPAQMPAHCPTPESQVPASTALAEADGPALSVILATPGPVSWIGATLDALQAQTIQDTIELLIIVESKRRLNLDPAEITGFWSCRIIEVGTFRSVAHADAQGVRAACAPIVVFAEDHAFPEPDWAAALIEAHRGIWTAVGPLVINANPGTAISAADLILGYGPWIDPAACGERSHLPGHNSSYKRQALLSYGADLDQMLEAETVLQWDMRSKGLHLLQSREARIRHTNFSRIAPFAEATFNTGRAFGAARSANWSILRRGIFVLASPLIPLVRFVKILLSARGSAAQRAEVCRALPMLMLGLVLDSVGQMLGYGMGPGGSAQRLKKVEFNRQANITAKDRELLFGAVGHAVAMEAA
jgi:predicted dehydrogenase